MDLLSFIYLTGTIDSCYWTSIFQKILDVNIVDYSELLTLSYKNFAIKNTKIKTKITQIEIS